MDRLYEHAKIIIEEAIHSAMPDTAVKKALMEMKMPEGRLVMVAAGKAAWQMAHAAWEELGEKISEGIVITKYKHIKGEIPGVICYEAGHPVPDENSFFATEQALALVGDLKADDMVLFLLSGGGSALFEKPLVSAGELESITSQLLASGASIIEMNTVRKRISAVKGGRFAEICKPAQVFTVVLSDIIGDPLDMIASGPAYPDSSTCEQAIEIIHKYDIKIEPETEILLRKETPKNLDNVTTLVTGSVKQLCEAAKRACDRLGYEPVVLTAELSCQAKEAGSFLGAIGKYHSGCSRNTAFIAGGETVVKVSGQGLGGRNQELALAAAEEISGLNNVAVFSIGSDGTDGPTDAAGGYVNGRTKKCLEEQGISIAEVLKNNDAYHGLKAGGGLIITGPTGTNVNDVAVVLVEGSK